MNVAVRDDRGAVLVRGWRRTGSPRVARSPRPWQVQLGEHHVGLSGDRTREPHARLAERVAREGSAPPKRINPLESRR
jgi:hypothetical protein